MSTQLNKCGEVELMPAYSLQPFRKKNLFSIKGKEKDKKHQRGIRALINEINSRNSKAHYLQIIGNEDVERIMTSGKNLRMVPMLFCESSNTHLPLISLI